MLTEAQQAMLDKLRAENQAAGFPFTASPHWEWVNRLFEQWFKEDGIGDVIYQRFNDHYAGLPLPQYQQQWAEHLGKQLADPPYSNDIRVLLASLLLEKGNRYIHRLARYSSARPEQLHWDLLTACETLDFLRENDCEWDYWFGHRAILDLGGGWGRMGYAIRKLNQDAVYIQCDLPESLLISYEFLPKILNEPAGAPLGEFDLDKPGIYFIPAHKILDIPDKSLDLIVNIASFQETTREQIEAYYAIIDKKAHYFYSLQYCGVGVDDELTAPLGWKKLAQSEPYWGKAYTQALFKL